MKDKCPLTSSELSLEDAIEKHDEEIINSYKKAFESSEK